jgi:Prenyltransferase and squalene oxidase repeat
MKSRWPVAGRAFLLAMAVGGALTAAARDRARAADAVRPEDPSAFAKRIDASLQAAAGFLIGRQSADGAWRSEVYPPFRDGDALTPLTVASVLTLPRTPKLEAACRLGTEYLSLPFRADRALQPTSPALNYPVYSAAGAVIALSDASYAKDRQARDAWLEFLRSRQLTETLDWQPADVAYGGWGYAPDPPRKPKPGEPTPALSEPNLSATVFAIEALRAAGCGPDDPAIRKARTFVLRCQNFAEGPQRQDPKYDDGGFFFILGDAVRNKAGVAGRDAAGRERFNSYGSATADGLRALLMCGAEGDSARMKAARHWLDTHFAPDIHPGVYAEDREHARQAPFYYYARSQALAWKLLPGNENADREQMAQRAVALARELIKRQQSNGSWSNMAVDLREDDPLVATPLAAEALAACRTLVGISAAP